MLVLVDNGSEDQTPQIMQRVQNLCPPGAVHIVEEPVRGFVPARSAGPAYVVSVLKREPRSTLILQADADTVYLANYVEAMKLAACRSGPGCMLEGASVTAAKFRLEYPAFDRMCRAVDEAAAPWGVGEEDDVIVDDKVAAFFLSDYLGWGGHVEHCGSSGEPLLAETTRLFIGAKRHHRARKVKTDALALPSRRKLFANAPAYFASAGFPRGPNWLARWSTECCGSSAKFLADPTQSTCANDAVRARLRHELALFGLLPLLVDSNVQCRPELKALIAAHGRHLHPLEQALELADDQTGLLDEFIEAHAHRPA
jgi:hypothetical protein